MATNSSQGVQLNSSNSSEELTDLGKCLLKHEVTNYSGGIQWAWMMMRVCIIHR